MEHGHERVLTSAREWTYRCVDCGKETTARSPKAFLCRECADKRIAARLKKRDEQRRKQRALSPDDEEVHFCDTPENIQKCLNCTRPFCDNCHGSKAKNPANRKHALFHDVKYEVAACFKKGMTTLEVADKYGSRLDTAQRWKRRLRNEGLL